MRFVPLGTAWDSGTLGDEKDLIFVGYKVFTVAISFRPLKRFSAEMYRDNLIFYLPGLDLARKI